MDLFKQACWLACSFNIHRYLLSNSSLRLDGAEKALRHAELCSFYVAAVRGMEDTDLVRRKYEADYQAVHTNTQKLTDFLDEKIGFPLKGPVGDEFAPLFFEQFHTLALEALSVTTSNVIGYQVQNAQGSNWAERDSYEVLTEATAIEDLKEARLKSDDLWLMIAILDGDIEDPTFE